VTKTERSINRVGAMRGVSKRRSVTGKTMFAVENDDEVLTFASHLVTLFANHMKLLRGCPPAARVAYSLKPKEDAMAKKKKAKKAKKKKK
jgi:hypothetical protein